MQCFSKIKNPSIKSVCHEILSYDYLFRFLLIFINDFKSGRDLGLESLNIQFLVIKKGSESLGLVAVDFFLLSFLKIKTVSLGCEAVCTFLGCTQIMIRLTLSARPCEERFEASVPSASYPSSIISIHNVQVTLKLRPLPQQSLVTLEETNLFKYSKI